MKYGPPGRRAPRRVKGGYGGILTLGNQNRKDTDTKRRGNDEAIERPSGGLQICLSNFGLCSPLARFWLSMRSIEHAS